MLKSNLVLLIVLNEFTIVNDISTQFVLSVQLHKYEKCAVNCWNFYYNVHFVVN